MSKDISSQPGPINYKEKYPLTFGAKARKQDPDLSERRQQAWETARAASALLKESFGATRVVVFGSLVDPDRFSQWSDIDMAAWDIPPHRYFAAVAAVMNMHDHIEINLVEPEMCRPILLQAIERDGVDI